VEHLPPGILILISFLFHLDAKLLNGRGVFTLDLDGLIPSVIVNAIEGLKILADPILELLEIYFFVLIVLGNTGEIKGEILLLKGFRSLDEEAFDFSLLSSGARLEEENQQKKGKGPSHG
jgi:hypothetical protein